MGRPAIGYWQLFFKEHFPTRTLGAAVEDTTTSSSHSRDTPLSRQSTSAQVTLACDRVPLVVLPNGTFRKQMRSFGATTRELLSLREWLLAEGLHPGGDSNPEDSVTLALSPQF